MRLSSWQEVAGVALTITLIALPTLGRADTAGEALLQQCLSATERARTLQADYTSTVEIGKSVRALTGRFTLEKPNRIHLVVKRPGAEGRIITHSDGDEVIRYVEAQKEYTRDPADANGARALRNGGVTEAAFFLNPSLLEEWRPPGTEAGLAGQIKIGGVLCRVVEMSGSRQKQILKLFIGPDHLLRGSRFIIGKIGQRSVQESHLTNVRADSALPTDVFDWSPPLTARLIEPSTNAGLPTEEALLPVGATAPDFRLPTADGGKIALASIVRANKATLLDFWSYGSGPCRLELPELDRFLVQHSGKGFEVIAINSLDSPEIVDRYWNEHRFRMRAAVNGSGVARQYRVLTTPTSYLVGADGKILARFLGSHPAALREALEKAGVK